MKKDYKGKKDTKAFKEALKRETSPLLIGLRNELKNIKTTLEKNQCTQEVKVKSKDGVFKFSVDAPKKGKDYFTDEEIKEFLKASTPEYGVDFYTKKEQEDLRIAVTPVKGKDYFDGETPVKGIDYFTEEEQELWIKQILDRATPIKGIHFRDGIDGKTIIKETKTEADLSATEIRRRLESLRGKARLNVKAIEGVEELIIALAGNSIGGAGDDGGVGGAGLNSFTSPDGTITIGGTLTDPTVVVNLNTKAEFNAILSDGDFLFVGDVSSYTDEQAQDAVGAMVSANGSLAYTDATPSLHINLAHSNVFTAFQAVTLTSPDSDTTTAFQTIFNKDHAIANDDYEYSTMYAGITDSSNISGTIEDKNVQKSGFEVAVFRSNDSTVNWIDGFESVRGYTSYVAYAGQFQGAKHDVEMIGHDITVLHQVGFSQDGTHVHSLYGNKINVISTSVISIDAFVTRRIYGEYIEVSASSDGDVTEVYGLYIKDVAGGDTNYSIYSDSTAISHFEGAIEVPDDAYDATSWNGNGEVPTKNAIRDKLETMPNWVSAPASPIATGTAGQVSYDTTYFYTCIATNTWKRVAWDATWIAASYLLMQNSDKFVFQNSDGFKLQDSL